MKILIPTVLLFAALSGFTQTNKIAIETTGIDKLNGKIETFSARSANIYHYNYIINELNWGSQTVKTGDSFTKIWFKGSLPDGEIGEPEIPVIKKLVTLPLGASAKAIVKDFKIVDINLNKKGINKPLIPRQPSISKDIDTLDAPFYHKVAAYQKASFSSQSPKTKIEILGNLRGVTIARLTIYPVEYAPAKNKLRIYSNIDVEIQVNEAQPSKSSEINYSPFFEPIYKSMLNAGGVVYDEHPDLTRYPIGMLIVSDRMFESALQPFINWKAQTGFKLTVKYTDEIGSTSDAIKTYIQSVYNSATSDNPAPPFLVIVGDVDQVPASATGSQSGKLTDLYYASVDGDKFPEMYYGRLSATSEAQLTAIIDKILYYEKYQIAQPSYLNNATLIAGADAEWNPAIAQPSIKYATANHFNQAKGWNSIFEFGVSNDPNNPLAVPDYNGCYQPEKISVGFINYTAHCNETNWQDPALSITDVNNFSNNQQYPFVIANCCLSGNFGYTESIGEAWLRKTNGGAVSYIGSSPSSYWLEDMYWAVGAFPMNGSNNGYVPTFDETTTGAYDAPFASTYTTAGAIMFCGNLAVTQAELNDYSRQINSTYYWEAYNILGDPSLVPYLKTPEVNTVSFPEVIPVGVSNVNIYAKQNSYVSLYKKGEVLATRFYDTAGEFDITFPVITEPDTIILTVTRPQTVPFIDTIKAVPANGAYLTISQIAIDDSEGNSNGIADYGETVRVNLLVKNVGNSNATNIGAKITQSSGLITLASTDSIGIVNIDAQSEIWVNSAFSFSIPSDIENKYSQLFPGVLQSDQGTWTANIRINVSAPDIFYNRYTISDTLMGNNNGKIEPGEMVELELEFENAGNSAIYDFSATATVPDTLLNLVSLSFEPIAQVTLYPGNKIKLRIGLSTSHTIDIKQIPLNISTSSGSYPKASMQYVENINIELYESVLMNNNTVKTCKAIFYDSGGSNSNYKDNENYTITFEPESELQKLKIEFINFSTEADYDFLYAYNGPTTGSASIANSPFHGSISPFTLLSNGSALTFEFTSDGSTTSSGWQARIQCIIPENLPLCVENPIPANNETNYEYSKLEWDASVDALFYDVFIGTSIENLAYVGRVKVPYIDITLLPNTTYYWRVIPGNHLGVCDKNCEVWSFTTGSVLGNVVMTNGTLEVDSIWFYDSGGPLETYKNNENYTLTFKPKVSGKKVSVSFSSFDVESESTCSYDWLKIYNGPNTNSPLLGTFCGSTLPGSFTSTSENGELTFEFKSDQGVVGNGWKAKILTTGNVNNYPLDFNISSGGSPISACAVSANGITRFSDTNGQVTFSLPNGSYVFTILAYGYAIYSGIATIEGAGNTLNIELTKLDTLKLLVRSNNNGDPIPLARIQIGENIYFTSASGVAYIPAPAGEVTLNASSKGFEPKDTIINLPVGGGPFSITLATKIYTTQILVTNRSGSIIENAKVLIDNQEAFTNSSGLANFELKLGLYKVFIQKEGYVDSKLWLNLKSDTAIHIYLDQLLGNVYNTNFTVQGYGPKNSILLDNALVKIFKQSELVQQGYTQNGRLNFFLPSSSYTYVISHEGYNPITEDFTIVNQPQEINVSLEQLLYNITFLVLCNENPVPEATVTLKGYTPQQTDASGIATFTNIGYELSLPFTVNRANYEDYNGTFDVIKSETITVNLMYLSVPNQTNSNIKIYPNPSNGYVKIESADKIKSYAIYSSGGVLIRQKQINGFVDETTFDVAPGIYIIQIQFGNGKLLTAKLVIR